ncbi:MAG: hypothetical protein NVSMB42_07810 [Herpetosiphon sp.]
MTNEQKKQLIARLKSIEGHVRGVQRMEDAGAYCIDLLKQTQAVLSALNKCNNLLLAQHLDNCVSTAIRSDQIGERERVVAELLEVFGSSGAEQVASSAAVSTESEPLLRIEEQVRGVAQMVEHDVYCIDIIKAALEIKGALELFQKRVLTNHLNGCVTTAVRSDVPDERARVMGELLQVFDAQHAL